MAIPTLQVTELQPDEAAPARPEAILPDEAAPTRPEAIRPDEASMVDTVAYGPEALEHTVAHGCSALQKRCRPPCFLH